MAVTRVVKSTLDKRNNFERRSRDRLGRTRKTGFSSRYIHQQNRGNSYRYNQYKQRLDVRKKIFKPYGRTNLSMINRRYYNRGNLFPSRTTVGKVNSSRRILSRYDERDGKSSALKRGGDGYIRKRITTGYRSNRDRNRRVFVKNYNYNKKNNGGDRRVFFDKRRNNNKTNNFNNNNNNNKNNNNRNLHGRIGKLSAKDLDAELDAYMGSNNVKSRLDNDLDSYFKNDNTTAPQTGANANNK